MKQTFTYHNPQFLEGELAEVAFMETCNALNWLPFVAGGIIDLPMMPGLALQKLSQFLSSPQAVAIGNFRGLGLLGYRDSTGLESFWIDEGHRLFCLMYQQT